MENKLKRAFLLAGLVLYLFDLGSDIYVAVQYWKNDEPWWFGTTVMFISVPSLFVNGAAIIQIRNIGTFLAAIFQLSIVVRYIEVLIKPSAKSGAFSRTYWLEILRYIETIAESAPQWCLQVYIMLRQESYPWYIVISIVLSLLSLVWSIMALEMERRKEYLDFSFINISLFLLWQLLTLVSRLFSIVLFAYVFRYYVFIPLAVHWSILVGSIFYIQISAGGNLRESLLSSVLYAYPSLLHFSKTVLPMRRPALEMSVRYISLILTTIIMATLSLAIEMPDVPNMDVIQPIAITSVVGVLPLSLGTYYCIHIRGDDDDDDD